MRATGSRDAAAKRVIRSVIWHTGSHSARLAAQYVSLESRFDYEPRRHDHSVRFGLVAALILLPGISRRRDPMHRFSRASGSVANHFHR